MYVECMYSPTTYKVHVQSSTGYHIHVQSYHMQSYSPISADQTSSRARQAILYTWSQSLTDGEMHWLTFGHHRVSRHPLESHQVTKPTNLTLHPGVDGIGTDKMRVYNEGVFTMVFRQDLQEWLLTMVTRKADELRIITLCM